MRALKISVIGVLFALLWPLTQASTAGAIGTTYGFNLVGPNTAIAPSGPHEGDTIRVTGSGTFDPSAQTVVASGSFTHFNGDGTVHDRGTWEATGFTSFTGYGGPNPGRQRGVLWIVVTHFPEGGPPHEGIPMNVTSAINAPPGAIEGTTVDDFKVKTGGTALFHLGS